MDADRPLSSWKEIAAHFGRDIRTVQRWEKDERLPVHRHPHRSRNSVYAYPSELDVWWRGQVVDQPPVPPAPSAPLDARRVSPWHAWGVVAAIVTIAAGSAWSDLGRRGVHAPPGNGSASWPLSAPYATVLIADIDGDGRSELALSSTDGSGPEIRRVGDDAAGLGPPLMTIVGDSELQILVEGLSDVNGDGLADLLISTTHLSETVGGTAPAYLVFGRRVWRDRLILPDDADVRLELHMDYDSRLGVCESTSTPDFNRDGLADIVLSAPEFGYVGLGAAGAVFVLHGRRVWPAVVSLIDEADSVVVGSREGEGLGLGCATGDWDGDGWPDLAAHAGEHTLWQLRGGYGRTYVIQGRPRWPRRVDLSRGADALLRLDSAVAGYPQQRIAMADVNGDGLADLIRTSPSEDAAGVVAIRIWMGGGKTGQRTGADQDVRIALSPVSPGWARQLMVADLDNDGCDDLVLSEGVSGALWRIQGRAAWPADLWLADAGTLLHRATTSLNGYSLSAARLGRGLLDLLVPTGSTDSSLLVVPAYKPLLFDLRPGAVEKLVLVPGPVAVRIAGDNTDVSALVPGSFRLNGAAPTHVRTGDDDRDGRPDLQVYFESRDMTFDGTSRVTLIARTRDGHLVGGESPITVVRR